MDPSIFFGRSRVTRQTSKHKEESTDKENLKSEVKPVKNYTTVNQKSSKGTLAEVKNDVIPARKNVVRNASKRGKKTAKDNDTTDVNSEEKIPETRKGKKVCFTDSTIVKDDDDKDVVSSGPVYSNVRRSDIRDDPVDEYAFDYDPSSESPAPPKKKKKRQTQKKNPVKSVVKWNPSKKPVVSKPPKPATKNLKSKPVEKVVAAATSNRAIDQVTVKCKEAPCSTGQLIPTTEDGGTSSDNISVPLSKRQLPLPKQKEIALKDHTGDTSIDFQVDSHFTSTPTMGQISSRLVPKLARLKNSPAELGGENTKCTQTANQNKIMCQSASVRLLNETQTKSPVCNSSLPSCSTSNTTTTTKQSFTKSSNTSAQSKQVNASLRIESTLKKQQMSTPCCTPIRSSPCVQIPTICVRESPSFMDSEPMFEVGLEASPISSSLQTKLINTVSSTPLTRSKTAVNFDVSKSTPTAQLAESSSSVIKESVSASPAVESSFKTADISKLFDDLPRTSVIPTRMFSTHRGTIFKPEEENINKRKLPELSPSKKQVGSRATTVKFSVPQTSSGVDDCFGFDDDDSPFIPKSNPRARPIRATEDQKPKKPNLSIQDVQALIRGQLQFVSPASSTPRSVQTKLTDFVSSTPTTRSKNRPNPVILTPTPVPLFGEENLDTELPSPFTQLSRRSYDRFRPVKRVACGDEVLSGDEADENDVNQNATESTGVEIKKKNRSYRKKKKPEETQLNNWAQQMASHFDEVDDIDLEIK